MEFKLILKKINNTLNEEERKIFDAWHHESEEHRTYFNRVKENYSKALDLEDVKNGWDRVSSKIDKRIKQYPYFKYAAAIAVVIAIGSLWFSYYEKVDVPVTNQSPVAFNDLVKVGTDKATLTLEDGSNVALEKGVRYESEIASSNGEQLIYKGGPEFSQKPSAQNVLTIPRGGQFFVALPDGTKVWMNSDSQLKYPVSFVANETREVELVYGEAYFEVSPSTEHNGTHFVAHSNGQHVEVLGTQFNIKAYKEENIVSTTLIEGKVMVDIGGTPKALDPGDQSKLDRNSNKLTIDAVDIYNEVSWKNGFFSFKELPLKDLMKILSRWYDVDVEFQNEEKKFLTFNGVFRKSQQLDEILNILKNTNEVNYKISGKTIVLK